MKSSKLTFPVSENITETTFIFNWPIARLIQFSRIFLVLTVILLGHQLLSAAPGDLDSAFGTGGKVLTGIGAGAVTGRGMVIQPDGKIVVAGATDLNNPTSDFLVIRFNADGTLDTTFDGDGKATTDFGGKSDSAFAVALQSDGRIVVVGHSGTTTADRDFAVARYNTDGSLDTSFDGDGRATTDFGGASDEAYAVAIAPTGKIVVAGNTSARNGDFAAVRYLTDGSLDTSFDSDGRVTEDGPCQGNCFNGFDRARGVVIYPDGKIIIGGDSRPANSNQVSFATVRYLDSGALDTSWGSAGRAWDSPAANSMATSMALRPDGRIVVAGGFSSSSTGDMRGFAQVIFSLTGFIGNGEITTNLPGFPQTNYQINSIFFQPDGKMVVVGNFGSRFLVARYLNGTLDPLFGNNGYVTTEMNPTATSGGAYAVGIQADGKIVAAGYQQSPTGGEIAVARYLVDGCSYSLSSLNVFFSRINSNQTLTVQTQAGCPWTAVSGASWLTVVAGSPGSGPGTLTLNAELNTTTQPRTTTVTIAGQVVQVTQGAGVGIPRRTMFDFDNDGRADIGTVRFSNGNRIDFYTLASQNGYAPYFFGIPQGTQSNYRPIPADYDGDGTTNYAIWRMDTSGSGVFFIDDLLGARAFMFGLASDIPLPSDWNGDGRAEIAFYRPATVGNPVGSFQYRAANTTSTEVTTILWGGVGDKPVAADYDGDGKTDAAIFRPSSGVWYILRSSDGVISAVHFGISTDKPVPADYDGDGKADVAVFRDGIWYLNRSTAGFTGIAFGNISDIPVPADYDGDGKADVATFRNNGTWYLNRSTAGFTGVAFGFGSDIPVPSAYLP